MKLLRFKKEREGILNGCAKRSELAVTLPTVGCGGCAWKCGVSTLCSYFINFVTALSANT